ncbi:23S rRNA (adenine(1618)-N(6))-methyltransferase RlmF [Lutibacter citreus]|uniref:23S rRNA (adenine(1618)-N(6))-methyltransferase RlmF n=1 Tax=Lutibacter citreus TaxID=2138210 RepID=UPI000DBE2A90|nr:23S rRNA (adenine(1618)-N(6))-methyltransferase RlmF [Lutibacter citreus]
MGTKKNSSSKLHKNNKHRNGYDLQELCKLNSKLQEFVFVNKYGTETVDFANPEAVKELNRALLVKDYGIEYWDFPDDNLCPPIPGRVDYIHYLADLLVSSGVSKDASIIDIGVGANCIYPLLGNSVYGWKFLGTDIDKKSLDRANIILKKNKLTEEISLVQQKDASQIFNGILDENSKFSATLCNPPFFGSQQEAMQANARKQEGLGNTSNAQSRNFSGKQQELWYKGGEKAFIHTYAYESAQFKTNCFWYSTLVSKKQNAESLLPSLKKMGATEVKTIPMHQGNKVTRIVAWTFLTSKEQEEWTNKN